MSYNLNNKVNNDYNLADAFNSHFEVGIDSKHSITNPGSALERIARTKKNIENAFPNIIPDKIEYGGSTASSNKNIKRNYAEQQIAFNYALYSLLTAAENEIKNNVPLEKVKSEFASLVERISNQEGSSPIPSSINGNEKNEYLTDNNIFLIIYKIKRGSNYIAKSNPVKKRTRDNGDNL